MSKVLELKNTRKDLVAKLVPLAEQDELTGEQETSFAEMRAQAEGVRALARAAQSRAAPQRRRRTASHPPATSASADNVLAIQS